MILSPVLSLLWGPTVGVPVAIIVEVAPTLQLTPPALRIAHWRTVWSLGIPALLLIPAGSWLLVSLPAETMRRSIAIGVARASRAAITGARITSENPTTPSATSNPPSTAQRATGSSGDTALVVLALAPEVPGGGASPTLKA